MSSNKTSEEAAVQTGGLYMQILTIWCSFCADDQHSQYSKLLLASREQVLQLVILEEKAALLKQYEEEKHTPEACFIEAAIQELKVTTSWEAFSSFIFTSMLSAEHPCSAAWMVVCDYSHL